LNGIGGKRETPAAEKKLAIANPVRKQISYHSIKVALARSVTFTGNSGCPLPSWSRRSLY
jgi:hypothetical protein